ncbi:MAG: RNA 2',3'-cyclic phosphodiesterase [Betaproteobacteria bacterium]|nr:RNA 2',3'-cyclic phosphodiesterase [Betaproteobacteria bacterium]
MSEARSRRVFFALWPDPEAVGHLAALAQSLAGSSGGRLMHPATLHLTLAFIGSVTPTRLAELERIAAGIRAPAFDLSLDRLGFWPQRGILWAGCSTLPPSLRILSGRLAAALRAAGFAIAHRAGATLVPHVTLARRIRCAALPRLETPVRWRVDEFALVESHLHPSAASYKTLAGFPLAEAAAD